MDNSTPEVFSWEFHTIFAGQRVIRASGLGPMDEALEVAERLRLTVRPGVDVRIVAYGGSLDALTAFLAGGRL